MELSGEKRDGPAVLLTPQWTTKEKGERAEWFLIAGVIGVVGFGIFSIGAAGLLFYVHRGTDLYVDVFVCSLAMLMGLSFFIAASYAVYRLLRLKPTKFPSTLKH